MKHLEQKFPTEADMMLWLGTDYGNLELKEALHDLGTAYLLTMRHEEGTPEWLAADSFWASSVFLLSQILSDNEMKSKWPYWQEKIAKTYQHKLKRETKKK